MLSQITYILLDAARMGNTIDEAKELNPTFHSLYTGPSEESLAVVAPYLFLFLHKTEFINWFMEIGWGDSWGILIKSSYPLDDLHKHFRKFLIVGTEDNQQLYFRFYDPRVLRIFLPTCDMGQLRELFGPIEYFIMEDEDREFAIKCWLQNGILHSQKIKLQDLISGNIPPPVPLQQNYEAQKPSAPAENFFDRKPINTGEQHMENQPPSEPTVKKPAKPKWDMFD